MGHANLNILSLPASLPQFWNISFQRRIWFEKQSAREAFWKQHKREIMKQAQSVSQLASGRIQSCCESSHHFFSFSSWLTYSDSFQLGIGSDLYAWQSSNDSCSPSQPVGFILSLFFFFFFLAKQCQPPKKSVSWWISFSSFLITIMVGGPSHAKSILFWLAVLPLSSTTRLGSARLVSRSTSTPYLNGEHFRLFYLRMGVDEVLVIATLENWWRRRRWWWWDSPRVIHHSVFTPSIYIFG